MIKAAINLMRAIWWWRYQSNTKYKYYTYRDGTHRVNNNAHNAARLELRQRVAPILQSIDPGYGWCERCLWPWSLVDSHSTKLDEGASCFCLCTYCWRELGGHPDIVLPYYAIAYHRCWSGNPERPWAVYEAAVRRESPGGHWTACGVK